MRDDNNPNNQENPAVEIEGSVESNDSGLRATSATQDSGYPSSSETPGGAPEESFSSVATTASSKKMLIAGMGAVVIAGGYFMLTATQDTNVKEKTPTEKIQERSQKDAEQLIKGAKPAPKTEDINLSEAPSLPAPPPIKVPTPPAPPPPPVPAAPQTPVFPQVGGPQAGPGIAPPIFDANAQPQGFGSKEEDDKAAKALEARRKASIMVMGSGSGADLEGAPSKDKDSDKDTDKDKKDSDKEEKPAKDKSAFLGFGEGSFGETGLGKSKGSQIKATHIGRMDSMIAQGKVMNAVLETAINTDLPGSLRAIISRDVYAESGKAVLIPKGSRVIGTYEPQLKAGQMRVAVVWNRLIRPDGVDLAISAPGTDALGRSGVSGFVDDKFLTKLGNAFLISYVVPEIADRMFKVNGNQPVTSTTATNVATGVSATSSTSTQGAQRAQDSSKKFQDIIGKTIEESFSTKSTLFVDQGTEVNIFVNKDMVFPSNLAVNGMKVIK